MGQRMVSVMLALAGVVLMGALALLGYNVCRAAQSGPGWRRRLVGAGLSLLGLFGVAPAATAAEAPAKLVAADGKPLADSPEWKALDAAWREAGEVASGKRGPYPFDAAGKKRLLEAVATAGKDAEALQARGLLSEAEAGLLKQDLAVLVAGVQMKRPSEMKLATCYAPMPYAPAQDGLRRLAARLPLLEKLAAGERVQPDAARRVLGCIEQDLALLSGKEGAPPLSAADRAKAAEVRKAVAAHVARIRAALRE
ncbi:MAG: hypothetical protein FJ291_32575 [Planctomycetes bacterium]|nr:hypothetical protein [Planctomycetota bacterium]